MTANVKQLLEEASALDAEERMALAGHLMDSVSSESAIFAVRLDLAHSRMADIRSGLVTPVSREENLVKVKALLGRNSAE